MSEVQTHAFEILASVVGPMIALFGIWLTLMARRRVDKAEADLSVVQAIDVLCKRLEERVEKLEETIRDLTRERDHLKADLRRMSRRWRSLSAWLRRCAPELVASAPEGCLAPEDSGDGSDTDVQEG